MDSISKIKRMSNNHGKQETPTFGEIKSLIVNKIISDNKLNILVSNVYIYIIYKNKEDLEFLFQITNTFKTHSITQILK